MASISGSAKLSSQDLKLTIAELASEDGTLPPERELVDELGLSRSRLRRILAEMREESLIPPARVGRRNSRESNPQVQNLVRLANPADVIDLRLIIEPQLSRLAALKASSLEAARIVRAASTQKDASYGSADLAFHMEIASATKNTLARELYRMLRQVGTDAKVRLPEKGPPCPKRRRSRDGEHQRIARAIAERDPDKAEEYMRLHLLAVRAVIFDRMSPDTSGTSASSTAAE